MVSGALPAGFLEGSVKQTQGLQEESHDSGSPASLWSRSKMVHQPVAVFLAPSLQGKEPTPTCVLSISHLSRPASDAPSTLSLLCRQEHYLILQQCPELGPITVPVFIVERLQNKDAV